MAVPNNSCNHYTITTISHLVLVLMLDYSISSCILTPCIWSWSWRIKLTSCAAAENPMYSDSQKLRLAFPSSFDCQLTGPPADIITNAAREREVSGQVRWLESQ